MNNRKYNKKRRQSNLAAVPFDMFAFDEMFYFPRVNEADDTSSNILHANLLNSLYRKNTQLLTTNLETYSLNELVMKVVSVLKIMMTTAYEIHKFQISQIIQVGSFKNGTMRRGKNDADLVLLLNLVPSYILIEKMSLRIQALLYEKRSIEIIPKWEELKVEITKNGLNIFNNSACVSIRIAAYPEYINMINDYTLKVQVQINLAAISHSKFLEEHSNPFTKILSRVLRYIVQQNPQLSLINPWMIDAISCYAIFSNYSNRPLSLNQAFLRVFQLLSAGLFTQYYGISDPCENFRKNINSGLLFSEQEMILETSQKILNDILDNKIDKILNLTDVTEEIDFKMDVNNESQ